MTTAPTPSTTDHFDFIIIGSGPGGGTLAHTLAPSGKRILILERGPYLPREAENWNSDAVFVDGRYATRDVWHDKDGKPIHAGIHYFVGGNSKVYGAALLRLRARDFETIQHYGGISPAWPLSYTDFAPYYDRAETLYEVHGEHGTDPTDPAPDAKYPFPAVSHEPRIQRLFNDMQTAGVNPFPLPLGIRLLEEGTTVGRESKCVRCATCDGYPCWTLAKSDAESICVRPALAHPNVTIRTDTMALRLLTNAAGTEVTGVEVEHAGERETLTANVVVVACGAINSAALLLRSASDKHPAGLANGSTMVGRNYMRHNNTAMLAISREPNPTVFQKTIGCNDYYFNAPDSDLPLGHFQMLGKSDGGQIKGEAPGWIPFKPEFPLEVMAKHSIDFWMTSEDLPSYENGVTLDRDGGIILTLYETNMEAHTRLQKKLHQLLDKIGCHDSFLPRSLYLGNNVPIGGTAHQVGTVKFGTDPKTSVLDTNCKAHELDNLYVVDGSFFVSAGAVNPGLTIMANAIRVGDHLLQRYA